MQDGPFTRHKLELRRLRTQTTVGFVVFWILFIAALVLIAFDTPGGWWTGGLAIGWAAASVTRALIDAHHAIEETKVRS